MIHIRLSIAAIVPVVASAVFACSSTPPPKTELEPAASQTLPAAKSSIKGIETADLDRSVDPCTDFFQFSTGGWRTQHPRPDEVAKWGRRPAAREANRKQLELVLDDLVRKPSPSPDEARVASLYASCLDVSATDAAGIAPIKPLLEVISAVKTPADVQRAMRKLGDAGIQAPLGVVGMMQTREPANYVANIVAAGITLPDRSYYLDDKQAELRTRYRDHIARLLALAGHKQADASSDAERIIALETRLASSMLSSAAAQDPARTTHEVAFAQLAQTAPHIDWLAMFDDAHLARAGINVSEPAYLRGLDAELAQTPVTTWKAYLEWRVIAQTAPWLTKEIADAADNFRGAAGVAPSKSRRERCVELTESLLGPAVGRAYARTYFSSDAKSKAVALFHSLVTSLDGMIPAVTWMEPATKQTALAKLDATSIEVGYPDRAQDYGSLQIPRGAAWPAIAAAKRFVVADDRTMIGKPTPRDLWQLPPSSPDAYLEVALDQLVLPAGYLQAPIFDPAVSDAVNYGAIGVSVAHDLTHAIDRTGSELDKLGRPVLWWTDADRAAFTAKSTCVADHYASYEVEPGLHLDGKKVLDEAIGDLAGIRIAHAALQRHMATHPIPTIDGFTPEQQFFIAWAQFRGDDVSIEAQRQMVASDSHAVPRWRIDATVADSPEFARAFSCKPGSAMVRPPEKHCVVW